MNQDSVTIVTYPDKMIIKSGDQIQNITSNDSIFDSNIVIYILRRKAMSEENKKPAFGDIIIRAIKEPEYWDKMESVIDDYVENVYDIDNTSMYDVKPIAMELEPSNILSKIKLPVKS